MRDVERHYAGKVILVTGGAGAVGSNLTRALAERDARTVVVLDDLSAGFAWNLPSLANVLFVEGSVTDEASLKRVFGEAPEIVFHLAAFFGNQQSVDYPERDLWTNGMGSLRLLEYAQMCGVERVVYASSGCSIYGNAPLPLREETISLDLATPYQITKMLGELYANFFQRQYGLRVVVARLFNSYGPGEVPGQYRNVIPNFIFRALRGEPLPLTGDPDATRDFTFVGDVVDALLRAGRVEDAIGREFNVASGVETRIAEVAELVNELTGNRAGVFPAPRRIWDTKDRLLASVDRAKSILGYEPRTRFEDGLAATIAWFREHWSEIERDASFPPGMSAATRGVATRAPDGDERGRG